MTMSISTQGLLQTITRISMKPNVVVGQRRWLHTKEFTLVQIAFVFVKRNFQSVNLEFCWFMRHT